MLYNNNTSQRDFVFSEGGLRFFEDGSADTNEHEAWHGTGVPNTVYDRWANLTLTRHKKIIVNERKTGFWLALTGARLKLFNDIRFAQYTSLATAQAGFDDFVNKHFAGGDALEKIRNGGFWHSAVTTVNGVEYYEYNGEWEFAD